MKDENCGYCMRGELLEKFGIWICDLQVSSLILFKEQSKPGRCIVAYRDHVSEIVDIGEEERNLFMADVAHAARAIHKAFHPDKLNYGAYGDTGCHLHMHLCPKYLLIELGAQNNTVEEAMNACDPIAHLLDLVLSGEEAAPLEAQG